MENSELINRTSSTEKIRIPELLREMQIPLNDFFNARVAACSTFMAIAFDNGQVFKIRISELTGERKRKRDFRDEEDEDVNVNNT